MLSIALPDFLRIFIFYLHVKINLFDCRTDALNHYITMIKLSEYVLDLIYLKYLNCFLILQILAFLREVYSAGTER